MKRKTVFSSILKRKREKAAYATISSFLTECRDKDIPMFFDADYYVGSDKEHPLVPKGMDPLEHYVKKGWRENRDPSEFFSTAYYLEKCPDVAALGINPLQHYIQYGLKEGRIPSAKYEAIRDGLVKNYLAFDKADRSALEDYLFHSQDEKWMEIHVPTLSTTEIDSLILTITYGGGTEVFVRNNLLASTEEKTVLLFQYVHWLDCFRLTVLKGDRQIEKRDYYEFSHCAYALSKINIKKIILNNLVSWPSTESILSWISKYKTAHPSCFVNVMLHDFYSVCPSYTLLDQSGKYCGVRCDETGCRECMKDRFSHSVFLDNEQKRDCSIDRWRTMWGSFYVGTADVITVFSESSKEIIISTYPEIENCIKLEPHTIPPFKGCKIAVIGNLSLQKGAIPVIKLCQYLDENSIDDMQLYLFGSNAYGIVSAHFTDKGSYRRCDLPRLLAEEGIDVVFIPSVCPETFCYTVGEALSLGYPVACFDMGGQADQVRKSEQGIILNSEDPYYLYSVFRQFASEYNADTKSAISVGAASTPTKTVVVQDRTTQDFIKYLFSLRNDKSNYIPEAEDAILMNERMPRIVAFYLPQFHDFPENVKWFGRGFSEWTNTSRTLPQFTGHIQPHVPIDVGYYNLDTTSVMHRQAELAKKYGISAFCVYYYWFSGEKLMEKPMEKLLADKSLDFPFFFFWANEHWTRLWGDGADRETLHKMELLPGDAEKFMADALPYMKDPRYVKIKNKPILIIYKLKIFPKELYLDFVDTIQRIAKENGFDGIYLSGTIEEWMDTSTLDTIQKEYRLDAITEFSSTFGREGLSIRDQAFVDPNCRSFVFDVPKYIHERRFLRNTNANIFSGLFTNWDNSPRRYNRGGSILQNTPEDYKLWLSELIKWTKENHPAEEQFIFVNAWNEWAESAHLEPDTYYGYAYLQKTREALEENC